MARIVLRSKGENMNDVTVVMPCYNENVELVSKTYADLQSMGCKVIVVDDGGTMDIPPSMSSITYTPNMGYGHAIKVGIDYATTPYIITMDGDGQHTASDVQKIYTVFKLIDDCAMLVGCRWNLNESSTRWIGRKCLNFLASLIARHYLVDLNSGMRMFRKDLAVAYKPILCDTFSFTTSLSMSMVTDGYKVAYFPINVQPRTYGKSRVRVVKDGLITLYYIFRIGFALRTRKIRACMRRTIGRVT